MTQEKKLDECKQQWKTPTLTSFSDCVDDREPIQGKPRANTFEAAVDPRIGLS